MKSKDRAELLAVEQTATDLLRRQTADEAVNVGTLWWTNIAMENGHL